MKVSYGEGLATHTDPESCVLARKGEGEALTGGMSQEVRPSASGILSLRRPQWS